MNAKQRKQHVDKMMQRAKQLAEAELDKAESKKKMSKGSGVAMFGLLFVGILLLWASIESFTMFVLSLLALGGSSAVYKLHLKNGGITIQEAYEEGKNKNK